MTTVKDVYEYLKIIAPEEMAYEADNVGFLVGSSNAAVSKILVCLDITSVVITEALDSGVELIVSHHPLFTALKSVTDSDITGKKVVRLLSGGISAICMHTNLDAVRGGVNDALAAVVGIADDSREAELLSLKNKLASGENISLGRVGYLKEPCSMTKYLGRLKEALKANGLRYHDAGIDVHKIAISSGGGSGEWDNAVASGCDTFITADIKYKLFLAAKELGINLIDGGHFCTENPVSEVLFQKLSNAFPETEVFISKTLDQTISFF